MSDSFNRVNTQTFRLLSTLCSLKYTIEWNACVAQKHLQIGVRNLYCGPGFNRAGTLIASNTFIQKCLVRARTNRTNNCRETIQLCAHAKCPHRASYINLNYRTETTSTYARFCKSFQKQTIWNFSIYSKQKERENTLFIICYVATELVAFKHWNCTYVDSDDKNSNWFEKFSACAC